MVLYIHNSKKRLRFSEKNGRKRAESKGHAQKSPESIISKTDAAVYKRLKVHLDVKLHSTDSNEIWKWSLWKKQQRCTTNQRGQENDHDMIITWFPNKESALWRERQPFMDPKIIQTTGQCPPWFNAKETKEYYVWTEMLDFHDYRFYSQTCRRTPLLFRKHPFSINTKERSFSHERSTSEKVSDEARTAMPLVVVIWIFCDHLACKAIRSKLNKTCRCADVTNATANLTRDDANLAKRLPRTGKTRCFIVPLSGFTQGLLYFHMIF